MTQPALTGPRPRGPWRHRNFSAGKRESSPALNGVTFQGATLRDVSFRASNWKYRTGIRTVSFDGARMDKLTYTSLKGMGADRSNVTVQ
jgi:hypothetical protein